MRREEQALAIRQNQRSQRLSELLVMRYNKYTGFLEAFLHALITFFLHIGDDSLLIIIKEVVEANAFDLAYFLDNEVFHG